MQFRGNKKSLLWMVLLIVSLILGSIDAFKLYQIDLEIWSGRQESPSFCNVSDYINCDAAVLSEYSSIFGIQNSIFGFSFYSVILLVVLASIFLGEGIKKHFIRVVFLSSVLASLYGIYLGYILVAKVNALCILCIGSYIINFALALFSYLLIREGLLKAAVNYIRDVTLLIKDIFAVPGRGRWKAVRAILLFMSFIGAGIGIVYYLHSNYKAKTMTFDIDEKMVIESYLRMPKEDISLPGYSEPWGRGKKVKIYEFSDFMCPFCKRAAFMLKNILTPYKDSIELIYKNYPLDSTCNSKVTRALHPKACLMAFAVLCADQKSKFWRFNDYLFENGQEMGRDELLDFAFEEKIDRTWFDECLDSEKVKEIVSKELSEADSLNIAQTPTIIINGRILRGLPHPRIFQIILNYELGNSYSTGLEPKVK